MEGEFRKDLTTEQRAINKGIADEIESFKGNYFMVSDVEAAAKKSQKPSSTEKPEKQTKKKTEKTAEPKNAGTETPAEELDKVASAKQFWNQWYEANKADWDYTTSEKLSVMFFDTRFAKYWSNLSKLNLVSPTETNAQCLRPLSPS